MRIGVCIIALLALGGLVCSAQDVFVARGSGTGDAVLWFAGTRATAEFVADFTLTGTLTMDGTATAFSATGWARGSGTADTSTLTLDAWINFSATGETEDGERIVVHGGMTPSSVEADMSGGTTGSASGDFLATVFLGDVPIYVKGHAEGTASGGFVVPDDPLTMQVAGEATFDMDGTILSAPASTEEEATPPGDGEPESPSTIETLLPWAPESWPEGLLQELLNILGSIETEIQTGSETVDDEAEGA